ISSTLTECRSLWHCHKSAPSVRYPGLLGLCPRRHPYGNPLHRRQIFDWKHHALVLISYVKNLRNRRSLLVPLRGFTLAEVLITLGIIGVVAALTIPTLMQKTHDREVVAAVKKNASVFSQAFESAVAEHGTTDKWDLLPYDADSSDKIVEKIKPYLKITSDCGHSICSNYNVEKMKWVNGTEESVSNYTSLSNNLILSDGTVIFVRTVSNGKPNIVFDINGQKGPNVIGEDIFRFDISPAGTLYYPAFGQNPADGCLVQYPWNCTEWVLFKENIDYTHCDDLTWDNKTKCD
ncbi:type II secretion system protein, partial [bacterium]|nr:type II secretion system protein [bacterium]